MRRSNRTIATALLIFFVLVTAGCGHDGLADSRDYVQKVLARPARPIPPLQKVPKYEAYVYSSTELRNPFEQMKPPEDLGFGADDGLRPNVNRIREALEAFPLDSLKMVGSINRDDTISAIIKDSDGIIHRVQMGNYIGQNFGSIKSISENQIQITEIVTDGGSGWHKREATIVLGE